LTKNSPKEAVFQIQKATEKILENKKFPVILGGEHTLTLGVVLALKKFFKNDFSILQFDAHSDLRDEFEGTKYHHATFARRIVEDLKIKICQVGIRAISKEEFEFIKKEKRVKVFYKRNYEKKEILDFLTKKVYLTIDLDALDPSIMPAVGTPEPEGLFFENILEIVKEVSKEKEILGFDVVELSPIPGFFAPNYLAAKLISKILGITFEKNL
jgi:agmatinase